MKNDQSSERPRDPRHIYANPLQPEVCPILSLGYYYLCFAFATDQNQLFPGSNQDDRFKNTLQRILKPPAGLTELERRGATADSFGSHSIRKGSATYSTSGTTSCPSAQSVHRRAGWSMCKISDIYMRYEAAGDQFVGRTVSGLPPVDADFAILPPFFGARTHADMAKADNGINSCFINLPAPLRRVAAFCLASVVYHHDWLVHGQSPAHPSAVHHTNLQ